MEITFPEKQADVAELIIDGNLVAYKLPPAVGTHSECYADSNYPDKIARATGREIVAYAYGALVYKKNEWADQERVRFPTKNYLRVPKVLTIVPKTAEKKFGNLEGAMIVSEDLKGEGIEMKVEVPGDLAGWEESEGGIFKKDGKIVVSYDGWYKKEWDEDNGAVIAIFDGKEYAISLARTAKDSKRSKPFWKDNPSALREPIKRVPVVFGVSGRLSLGCGSGNDGDGCAPRVLK